MSSPLRVATYNLHAGVDGWGRETDVVDVAVALDADILFLQESWRSATVDLAAQIAARTGATARTHALASGTRVTGGSGDEHWWPRDALLRGSRGLFLDSELALGEHAAARRASSIGAQDGDWCLGLVTRLPVLAEEVLELRHLPRDRARRRLVVTTLAHDDRPILALGLHGSHLSHGSLGQYRELARDLDALCAPDRPAVLGGDLNCWGPVARRILGGWRQAAVGRTWPSWRPHSQVDHLFVRGPIEVLDGAALDRRASDHRPVIATLEVGSIR